MSKELIHVEAYKPRVWNGNLKIHAQTTDSGLGERSVV